MKVISAHKFPYKWTLKDAVFTKDKGKVFSCFACGGGSTMGYKLAGYDVIGCNEIDPLMMEAYILNHNPKYSYLEPIQTFRLRKDLPAELYDLDILDGSPPCSSFSVAGNREKDWGKDKKFREGQVSQVLDRLFFDFIELAEKLQPKAVVAENVKGLLVGDAKKYVIEINKAFDRAGYDVQHFLLDSSQMGVPQKRERVFFVAIRKDLSVPFLKQVDMFTLRPEIRLDFNTPEIPFGLIREEGTGDITSDYYKELWDARLPGDADFSCINARVRNKPNTGFGTNFVYDNRVCNTLTSKKDCVIKFSEPRYLSVKERALVQTFPLDYNYGPVNAYYLQGMSVPPVMTAQIASRIYDQWLSKITVSNELKQAI